MVGGYRKKRKMRLYTQPLPIKRRRGIGRRKERKGKTQIVHLVGHREVAGNKKDQNGQSTPPTPPLRDRKVGDFVRQKNIPVLGGVGCGGGGGGGGGKKINFVNS